MMGRRLLPLTVKAYSTCGGLVGSVVLVINLSFSRSLSWSERTLVDMAPMVLLRSLNRCGLESRLWMMTSFHLPPKILRVF